MNTYIENSSFQGYFTNANDLRDTMVNLLGDVSGKCVLEPCFGEGAFIKNLIGKPSNIDAVDIDDRHFKNNLKIENCNFYNLDFIDYFVQPSNRKKLLPETFYDLTIWNPPYGLNLTKEYRGLIKKHFPMYTLRSLMLYFFIFQ